LISWKTFQRIQFRLEEKSHAVARADAADDFPLRGFVNCAACGHPMTAYWAKGRNNTRYPYCECLQKGCSERRKAIRRDELERAFASLLSQLRPSAILMGIAAKMFREIWDKCVARLLDQRREARRSLKAIDSKTGKLTNRLIDTQSPATIRAYEAKLEKLEAERALIAENLAQPVQTAKGFAQSFRTSMAFLAKPENSGIPTIQTTAEPS